MFIGRGMALAVVVAAASLWYAQGASASLYSGPWDSAHQPSTINSPEIIAGGVDSFGTFSVFPAASDVNSFCPTSWAVTFQDPAGAVTETMTDTKDLGFCIRSATQTATRAPDFTVTNSFGAITNFSLNTAATEAPFLYEVMDATGRVIAQGPYTRIHGTFRINSGGTRFEEVCLDGHHAIYSDPKTGVIYCLNTETFDKPGWPAPPSPAPPLPPPYIPPPSPELTPPPPAQTTPALKPHAKYTMTLGHLNDWAWSAVIDRFYGGRGSTKLSHFRVPNCSQLSNKRFRCGVSWRKRAYAFSGTVVMGDLNPKTGEFRFGFSLTRRTIRTAATKRIHVAY
jgi:hypothetical protein